MGSWMHATRGPYQELPGGPWAEPLGVQGTGACKVPHGWNSETQQEYSLDAEGVWKEWSWTPNPEFERDNP